MLLVATALLLQSPPVQAQAQPHSLITTFPYTPFEDTGSPLVSVKLIDKDHTGAFLLDTGSGPVTITEAMAAKLNLKPKPMIVDGKPFLVAGKPVAGVHLAVLQVGQFPVAGEAIVLKDKDLSVALGTAATTVDGIIGMNMLATTAILFDPTKHEITLWYPGNLPDAEVHRLGFMEAAVPLAEGQGEKKGVFTTVLQVANGPYHAQDAFLIDTGSNHTRLSYSVAQQLKLSPLPGSFSPATTVGGPVGSYTAVLETLQLGQFTSHNRLIDYPAQDESGIYGSSILGMDKLARFRVLMDFPAKKMYLQKIAPPPDPPAPPAVPGPQPPPAAPPSAK